MLSGLYIGKMQKYKYKKLSVVRIALVNVCMKQYINGYLTINA